MLFSPQDVSPLFVWCSKLNSLGLLKVLHIRFWSLSYILGGRSTRGKCRFLKYHSLNKHGGRAKPPKLWVMGCGNTDSRSFGEWGFFDQSDQAWITLSLLLLPGFYMFRGIQNDHEWLIYSRERKSFQPWV